MYAPDRVFSLENNWPASLFDLVEEKHIKEKAYTLLAEGAKPDGYEYGHELYGCKKCHNLEEKFRFRLVSSTGKYVPAYHCSKCNRRLTRLKGDEFAYPEFETPREDTPLESRWKCPKCSSTKLTSEHVAMWD